MGRGRDLGRDQDGDQERDQADGHSRGERQGEERGQGQGQEQSQGRGPDDAGLSDRDRAVLAVERRGWPGPGAKERAIRERLGISPTRYYQLLNALLDDPRALEHDPVTVNRLRRVRAERRERR
ncbi:DUF3263 domain-containing protein [Streptomyces hygroscopicus]|uniref:DUF3263 domain-containing protein n=1 Tax=Streptomyces hygroscopicus TaxID=1912 RepID=UPI00363EF096